MANVRHRTRLVNPQSPAAPAGPSAHQLRRDMEGKLNAQRAWELISQEAERTVEGEIYFNIVNNRATPDNWDAPTDEGTSTLGHPFAFAWPNDVFRDQVVQWLLLSDSRKRDFAGETLLRWLLYRFRVAKRRRKGSVPARFPITYRWVWAQHAEISRDTGLSADQIRRAVEKLKERGLIETWWSFDVNNNLTHFRPSEELWRALMVLTIPVHPHYVETQYQDRNDQKWHRAVFSDMTRHDWEALRDIVAAFGRSRGEDRVTRLARAFVALWRAALVVADKDYFDEDEGEVLGSED